MKSLGFVLFLAACGFKSTPGAGLDGGTGTIDGNGGGGGGGSDASTTVDAAIPIDAQLCFGHGLLDLCLDAAPTGDLTLANLDTGNTGSCTKVITQAGGPELCVVAARTITVNSNVTAIGSRALVLVAADKIDVQSGSIDASSRLAPARKGAAA
ncbi:MAG TPA: hypothetical protein VGC42_04370, partial [Kofleriaceae bacterium]